MKHGYSSLDITPVIVTRGNVDLAFLSNQFDLTPAHPRPVIWNNARSPIDLKVFGAFAAAACVQTPLIYMQDDDVEVARWLDLFYDHWEPGKIVCNMAPDFQQAYAKKKSKLMGHGSIFETALVWETFERRRLWERVECHVRGAELMGPVLLREAHRLFTGLNFDKLVMAYVGHTNKDYASDPNRLWKESNHADWHARAEAEINAQLEWETTAYVDLSQSRRSFFQ